MYTSDKTISAYTSSQIAYPVGPNKDSYNIGHYFIQDLNTLEVTVKHELIKNWMSSNKETLYTGTYKECVEYLKTNILNTQKEWIRDAKLNYIYPED